MNAVLLDTDVVSFALKGDSRAELYRAHVAGDSVKRAGRTVSCADAWVAATALRHGIPLITHNAKDFITIPNLTVLSAV